MKSLVEYIEEGCCKKDAKKCPKCGKTPCECEKEECKNCEDDSCDECEE